MPDSDAGVVWIQQREKYWLGVREIECDAEKSEPWRREFKAAMRTTESPIALSAQEMFEFSREFNCVQSLLFDLQHLGFVWVCPEGDRTLTPPPSATASLNELISWVARENALQDACSPMTIAELNEAGSNLFGRDWERPFAKAAKISDRALRRMLVGKDPIPNWMRGEVSVLASQRMELAKSSTNLLSKWVTPLG